MFDHTTWLIVLCGAGGLGSALGTALVRRWTVRRRWVDVPNARSSHHVPTPTAAGIAIVVSFTAAMLGAESAGIRSGIGDAWLPLLLCGAGVAALGLLDDVRGLSARCRVAVQASAALVFCLWAEPLRILDVPGLGRVPLGLLSYPLSVLWLVALTNFYNFMDGIDGIAGGTAVLVSAFFAMAFAAAGGSPLVPALLCAACLGFLAHNYPPATIFMGDVGSTFLGFVLGALAIVGTQQLHLPTAAFVLSLAMFILDTGLTLGRRIARGEKWYAAHRTHYYQRLVQAGWTHRRVDTLEFALTGLFCVAAYIYLTSDGPVAQTLLTGTVVGLFAGFTGVVRRAERSTNRAASTELSPPD